jgi:hypothetical protein
MDFVYLKWGRAELAEDNFSTPGGISSRKFPPFHFCKRKGYNPKIRPSCSDFFLVNIFIQYLLSHDMSIPPSLNISAILLKLTSFMGNTFSVKYFPRYNKALQFLLGLSWLH